MAINFHGWNELHNTLRQHYLSYALTTTITWATYDAERLRSSRDYLCQTEHNKYMQLLRYWLDQPGINVNIQFVFGRTVLHWAAGGVFCRGQNQELIGRPRNGRYIFFAAIRMLLAAGARCDIQDQNGDTPLHLAAKYGSVEAVRMLLAAGANCDLQNQNGQTAFEAATHCTSSSRRREIQGLIWRARHIQNELRPILQAAWADIPMDL